MTRDEQVVLGGGERASRRDVLKTAGGAALAAMVGEVIGACQGGGSARAEAAPGAPVKLPAWLAPSERQGEEMPDPWPPAKRVGVAVVGLGRLSLEQILPAFAASKRARPVALVSGDRAKAEKVAAQYGVPSKGIYDYASYDRLADNKDVEVVYVVLPNGMHLEYTVRAARAGKHVLCEKPMANTVDEARQMVDACAKAGRTLMIAYRMQYEPNNRALIALARGGELGTLKAISADNGQTQGDPAQWRLKKSLAGGGALPDVGVYCLNAARYLTGEEPIEVRALQYSTPNDPRFAEVEETVQFALRFPSGLVASSTTSYGYHESRRCRVMGAAGWAELDPAFSYKGLRMRVGKLLAGGAAEDVADRRYEEKNQFALELDHMAGCVREGKRPHTPGEEGLADMQVIAAIYEAAREGRPVTMPKVEGRDAYRGPAPA